MTKYHNTAPLKFVILSVATLGFYELYWCYKCWSYIKDEGRESIRPFWRAFFAPFWTYALFKEVYKGEKTSLGVAVFVSYFILQVLWELPDPYLLLSFLTIIPLLPVVIKVNKINKNEDGPRSPTYWRFGWKHWLISLLGIPVFAFSVFSSLNIIPSTQVISGDSGNDLGLAELAEDVSRALPSYRIVEEIPYDAPIKTQIEYEVVLEESTDAANIQILLEHLLDLGIKRRGYSYHGGRPTHIFAYVYPSEEHTGANWIGMVSQIGRGATPRFEINKELLNLPPPDEWGFGLSLDQRKELFREVFILENTARIQAEATYPSLNPMSPGYYSSEKAMPIIIKQRNEQIRIENKLQEELFQRYEISENDLNDIVLEGIKNNWPQPQ